VFKEIGLQAQTLLTFLNSVVNTIRGPRRSFKKRIFTLIVSKIFRSKNCEENHLGLYLDSSHTYDMFNFLGQVGYMEKVTIKDPSVLD
jgi:hypothetical protein